MLILSIEKVGTYNSTGKRYRGHFSIWITNEIHEMREYLRNIMVDPPKPTGWVNGNLYVKTEEVAGILPIPADVRVNSGMLEYLPSISEPQLCKKKDRFLAQKQGVRKPALPFHTPVERSEFRRLMRENAEFTRKDGTLNLKAAVKIWNSIAERRDDLDYKVSSALFLVLSNVRTFLICYSSCRSIYRHTMRLGKRIST
jgi:hypothetical protein